MPNVTRSTSGLFERRHTLDFETKAMPQDITLIRMNVPDFDEAYDFLISRGFENEGGRVLETASNKSAMMTSPSGYGWLGWAKDGELAGSAGYAKRAESIELCLVAKGESAPSDGGAPYRDAGFSSNAHVQNIGWQNAQTGYSFGVGTTGRGLRVEALTISRPSDDRSSDVIYEAHVQNVGWQGERQNGQVAGTSGRGLRLEALRVHLTGDLESSYDVWYRVHVQDLGWMGWTKNGEKAGTQGASKRMEAVQVAFVTKGGSAPSSDGQTTAAPFVDTSAAKVLYNSTSSAGAQDVVDSKNPYLARSGRRHPTWAPPSHVRKS